MKAALRRKSKPLIAKRKLAARQRQGNAVLGHSKALAKRSETALSLPEKVEQVLIAGDLTPLTPEERLDYYKKVCTSLGLNPMTRPFEYLVFRERDDEENPRQAQGKLVLYARRDAGDQLRRMHGIGIFEVKRWEDQDYLYAEAKARARDGREDAALAVVLKTKWKNGYNGEKGSYVKLSGRELANARMKVETKAKRRVTLSICGLGFLDESELDTMQITGGVTPDGRIYHYEQKALPEPKITDAEQKYLDRLTPEQREVEQKKIAEMQQASRSADHAASSAKSGDAAERGAKPGGGIPALFYEQQDMVYVITGDDKLKHEHRELLAPLYDRTLKQIIASPEQFGKLLAQFEKLKVPFKNLKPEREPGE